MREREIVKPCGTAAAAERHRRKGEELDEACRLARNADRRRRSSGSIAARKKLAAIRLVALERLAKHHPAHFAQILKEEVAYQQ